MTNNNHAPIVILGHGNRRLQWGACLISLLLHVTVITAGNWPWFLGRLKSPGGARPANGVKANQTGRRAVLFVPLQDPRSNRTPPPPSVMRPSPLAQRPRQSAAAVSKTLAGRRLGFTAESGPHLTAFLRRYPQAVAAFRVEGDFGNLCHVVALLPSIRPLPGRCVTESDGFAIEVDPPEAIPELARARQVSTLPRGIPAVGVVILPHSFGTQLAEQIRLLGAAGDVGAAVIVDLSPAHPLGFSVKLAQERQR